MFVSICLVESGLVLRQGVKDEQVRGHIGASVGIYGRLGVFVAVGVSSRKASGLSAAISVMPASRRKGHPVSWTMRSRAKREAVSTMIVRTPLLAACRTERFRDRVSGVFGHVCR